MTEPATYTEVATKAGISPSYANQIVKGKRTPPLRIAVRIYDATGLCFGPLVGLTKRDIEAARKMAEAA